MNPSSFSFENQFMPCECCKPKYRTFTSTATTGFKWSKKDIQEEIIEISKQLSKAGFWQRGNIRRRLKHWTEKLERLEDYQSEFK